MPVSFQGQASRVAPATALLELESARTGRRRVRASRLELLCWCAPLPCHAEVIRSALAWLAEQQR